MGSDPISVNAAAASALPGGIGPASVADLPHGIRLTLRRNRSDKPLPRALLLHGFPEAAFAWDEILRGLDGRVEAVAPNLRGFADSSAPSEVKAYRPRHLVADVAALISHWGAPLDLLVAHDWGGAVAWNLAARHPGLIRHLLIINSPHPAAFLRELTLNPRQARASAYMNFLCRPDAATRLREDDFRRLWAFFTPQSPAGEQGSTPSWLTESQKARYRELWQAGLEGGLNYYRASPLRPPIGPDSPIHQVAFRPEDVTVTVPTTVLWGLGDAALLPGLLQGLSGWVPRLRLIEVPDASHWIVHEQPGRVIDLILDLVSRPSTAGP